MRYPDSGNFTPPEAALEALRSNCVPVTERGSERFSWGRFIRGLVIGAAGMALGIFGTIAGGEFLTGTPLNAILDTFNAPVSSLNHDVMAAVPLGGIAGGLVTLVAGKRFRLF